MAAASRKSHRSKQALLLLAVLVGCLGLLGQNRQVSADRLAAEGMPNWSSVVHVSTSSTIGATDPAIATSVAGDILISFTNLGASAKNLMYVKSVDNGASWSAPASIHTSAQDSEQSSLAFALDGTAMIVWREATTPNQIRFARQQQWSANGFTTVQTSPVSDKALVDPDVAVAPDGTIHVVWAEETFTSQRNIYHSMSGNNGSTWTAPAPLATDNRDSAKPTVAVDSVGKVHVAWEETTLRIDPVPVTAKEIEYRLGTFSGGTLSWASMEVLTPDFTKAVDPSLVTAGNEVHLSFARQGLDPSLEQYAYYMVRSANGAWSTPVDTSKGVAIGVNGSEPYFLVTSMARCGGTVHLYYHGTYLQSENERIYGGNQAQNWFKEEVNTGLQLTTRAINPSLACTNKLHLAIERIESEQNLHQIYYVRGALPGQTFLPTLLR